MKKLEIKAWESLDSVVDKLLMAKERGEQLYCDFEGHLLYSDTVTLEDAYKEVTGQTKEERSQEIND